MSQKVGGIPQVSTATAGRLLSTDTLEDGTVPVYWGPGQDTTYGYVPPSGYNLGLPLAMQEVVRFFYENVNYTPSGEECTVVVDEAVSEPSFGGEGPPYWVIVYHFLTADGPTAPTIIGHMITPDTVSCTELENLYTMLYPTASYGVTCEFKSPVQGEDVDALQEEYEAQLLAVEELTC